MIGATSTNTISADLSLAGKPNGARKKSTMARAKLTPPLEARRLASTRYSPLRAGASFDQLSYIVLAGKSG